jgi:hypothetical protein
MKKFIYLDIDGVLSLGSEVQPKSTRWGSIHRFNKRAVQYLNEILEKTNADIIISSDWKNHFTLEQLQEIFTEWAGICKLPIDVTPTIPGVTLQRLEEWRAKEILQHVEKFKPVAWVAVDDLFLNSWISDEHCVYVSRFMEGIKQTGKKQEIINKLIG